MTTLTGKCHCGETQWTATLPDTTHILCHCTACKVMSGTEYTLNQIIPKENFKLTKGDLKRYTYKGDSGNNTDCFFCPNCSANAYHHQHVMGDDIVIRTALLEGSDKWGKPSAEIYGKQKLPWQPQVGENLFETTPPS